MSVGGAQQIPREIFYWECTPWVQECIMCAPALQPSQPAAALCPMAVAGQPAGLLPRQRRPLQPGAARAASRTPAAPPGQLRRGSCRHGVSTAASVAIADSCDLGRRSALTALKLIEGSAVGAPEVAR